MLRQQITARAEDAWRRACGDAHGYSIGMSLRWIRLCARSTLHAVPRAAAAAALVEVELEQRPGLRLRGGRLERLQRLPGRLAAHLEHESKAALDYTTTPKLLLRVWRT